MNRIMFALLLLLTIATAHRGAASAADVVFHWENNENAGTADLLLGDQPVLRYMYAFDASTPERLHDTYKVFHHVFGPGSKTIITKGPGGKFTHHRGLYVGWNKTGFEGKSADFWHCSKGAHLRHAKFIEMTGDAKSGGMTAEIHWNDADGKPVIIETRSVLVSKEPTTGGWQIDWSTRLASQRGDITFDGDRQHAGFQFRAAQPIADSNGGRFLRPATFPQEEVAIQVGDKGNPPPHINLGWFALTYELDGQRYNVEYFDNPNLPKPALFSERPYGRFGTFFKTTLKAGSPLKLQYRVVVSAGDQPAVGAIQSRYDAFVESLKH
jgi:hypothetical protein